LLSQINQLKQGCRQVKESSDRVHSDTLQTQCKAYGMLLAMEIWYYRSI